MSTGEKINDKKTGVIDPKLAEWHDEIMAEYSRSVSHIDGQSVLDNKEAAVKHFRKAVMFWRFNCPMHIDLYRRSSTQLIITPLIRFKFKVGQIQIGAIIKNMDQCGITPEELQIL
jgi:hypothetical protein